MNFIACFLKDESGVTAIEYALIGTLVALAIIAGAAALGTDIHDLYITINDCVSTPSACTLP